MTQKLNVRSMDGKTFYVLGRRFDVIEDGTVTYFRDALALISEDIASSNYKTPLRWLRYDGKPLEVTADMLNIAWNNYRKVIENEETLKEFKALMETVDND